MRDSCIFLFFYSLDETILDYSVRKSIGKSFCEALYQRAHITFCQYFRYFLKSGLITFFCLSFSFGHFYKSASTSINAFFKKRKKMLKNKSILSFFKKLFLTNFHGLTLYLKKDYLIRQIDRKRPTKLTDQMRCFIMSKNGIETVKKIS